MTDRDQIAELRAELRAQRKSILTLGGVLFLTILFIGFQASRISALGGYSKQQAENIWRQRVIEGHDFGVYTHIYGKNNASPPQTEIHDKIVARGLDIVDSEGRTRIEMGVDESDYGNSVYLSLITPDGASPKLELSQGNKQTSIIISGGDSMELQKGKIYLRANENGAEFKMQPGEPINGETISFETSPTETEHFIYDNKPVKKIP